jgi:hypothetical protein
VAGVVTNVPGRMAEAREAREVGEAGTEKGQR